MNLASLPGNVHPLARLEFDQGGWQALDPPKPPGWPILAVFFYARVGLPFASVLFLSRRPGWLSLRESMRTEPHRGTPLNSLI
jgi:hypothetical protein